ncbi:MAG: sigma factor-like helix-turn-helix DNA-binding protein [Myxococcota bacterium]
MLARLTALPARQQEILHLKLIDGLSYREIAAATGLTISNVGFLLHVDRGAAGRGRGQRHQRAAGQGALRMKELDHNDWVFTAYVLGELTPEGMRSVEERIRRNPLLGARVAGLEATLETARQAFAGDVDTTTQTPTSKLLARMRDTQLVRTASAATAAPPAITTPGPIVAANDPTTPPERAVARDAAPAAAVAPRCTRAAPRRAARAGSPSSSARWRCSAWAASSATSSGSGPVRPPRRPSSPSSRLGRHRRRARARADGPARARARGGRARAGAGGRAA